MALRFRSRTFSGSRKKDPRQICLSVTKASHSHSTWAEVSSPAPHFLHKGLSTSPIMWRCLLRVLCPVRMDAPLNWNVLGSDNWDWRSAEEEISLHLIMQNLKFFELLLNTLANCARNDPPVYKHCFKFYNRKSILSSSVLELLVASSQIVLPKRKAGKWHYLKPGDPNPRQRSTLGPTSRTLSPPRNQRSTGTSRQNHRITRVWPGQGETAHTQEV
jgi:hypothetical protein